MLSVEHNELLTSVGPGTPWARSCGTTGSRSAVPTIYSRVLMTFNQDYMCWITQGDIAKRHLEKLGESDRGIILFRKMLLEQVNLVHAGQEPSINIFREPAENAELDVSVIPNEAGEWVGVPRGDNSTYHPQEAGYSHDADKIEAVMATWKEQVDGLRRRGI